MKLYALDIPEEAAEIAGWLERHLVGTHLAELVAELTAVAGPGTSLSLRQLLTHHRADVLRRGLDVLGPEKLRLLLHQPALLLELQELVLTEGEAYWDRVPLTAEMRGAIEQAERSLQPSLKPKPRQRAESRAWFARPWLAALASAAAVLLVVSAWEFWLRPPPGAPGPDWGWARPGALSQEFPAPAYLARLAEAAAQWRQQRPQTADGLARRLADLRLGCTTLLLAEHRPLDAKTRDWLRERCRAWADKLDQQLSALEKGADPLQVRTEVDQIVDRLVDALHAKAKELQA